MIKTKKCTAAKAVVHFFVFFAKPAICRLLIACNDGNIRSAALFAIFDFAGDARKQRVILAHGDVFASMNLRAALANEDVASDHFLIAVYLDAQTLTGAVASVAGRPACFLVSHFFLLD